MKNQIPPLSEGQLTALAKALGDTSFGLSGSDINHLLEQAGIPNPDPEHTKWKRLYNAFATFQNRKQCSNNILNFCKYALDPAKNITNPNYDWLLSQTNQALLFIGHKISESGSIQRVDIVKTVNDARAKSDQLKAKLKNVNIHPYVIKYTEPEILVKNYFHTVLEASKSIFDRIRNETNVQQDGTGLIDFVFGENNLNVRINNYQNDTQKNEHKGLANTIRGVTSMMRNCGSTRSKTKPQHFRRGVH